MGSFQLWVELFFVLSAAKKWVRQHWVVGEFFFCIVVVLLSVVIIYMSIQVAGSLVCARMCIVSTVARKLLSGQSQPGDGNDV